MRRLCSKINKLRVLFLPTQTKLVIHSFSKKMSKVFGDFYQAGILRKGLLIDKRSHLRGACLPAYHRSLRILRTAVTLDIFPPGTRMCACGFLSNVPPPHPFPLPNMNSCLPQRQEEEAECSIVFGSQTPIRIASPPIINDIRRIERRRDKRMFVCCIPSSGCVEDP